MSLLLPGDIPVAARSLAAVKRSGTVIPVVGYDVADALASKTVAPVDEVIIWARPTLRNYKAVWRAAARMGLVDATDAIDTGSGTVDIDHVFPKSWAKRLGVKVAYVRLYPVWWEVNRSAGGRERLDPQAPDVRMNEMKDGIYFATDLQLRKMLNFPVGSTQDRTEIFNPALTCANLPSSSSRVSLHEVDARAA